jgi:hypothetical protein
MIEFKQKHSLTNGNKINRKNWQLIVAKSIEPVRHDYGVPAIAAAMKEQGQYLATYRIHFEEGKGFIFLEINHGCGINGYHPNVRTLIHRALDHSHIKVFMES